MSRAFFDDVARLPHPQDYFGKGSLKGEPQTVPPGGVYVVDQPAVRRGFLYSHDTMRVVADVWSAPDASFRIDSLNENLRYWIIFFDPVTGYRCEGSDELVPFVE